MFGQQIEMAGNSDRNENVLYNLQIAASYDKSSQLAQVPYDSSDK